MIKSSINRLFDPFASPLVVQLVVQPGSVKSEGKMRKGRNGGEEEAEEEKK